jgi:hypothetical protein
MKIPAPKSDRLLALNPCQSTLSNPVHLAKQTFS